MQRMPAAIAVPVPAEQHVVLPPARRARRIALVLSSIAVAFSLACGFAGRHAFALRHEVAAGEVAASDAALQWFLAFLILLLIALLLRMTAAICELLWLERTWSNMPEHLRKVGPMKDVSSGVAIAITFVPGIAWVWKLGLVVGIANGFEGIRAITPFAAPVPRRLGIAAVVVGWIPGLNVYIAPFLWEMFATRIDTCVNQILAVGTPPETEPVLATTSASRT